MSRPPIVLPAPLIEAAARETYEVNIRLTAGNHLTVPLKWDDIQIDERELMCKAMHAGIQAFLRRWL